MKNKISNNNSLETATFDVKYATNNFIANFLVNQYFKSIVRLIEKVKVDKTDLKALEVGCGLGYSTVKLTKILHKNVKFEASELLESQLHQAIIRNPDVKIIQEDVYCLKRENHSYDVIFLLEVLEHLENPNLALGEIKRVLKKNGYLIIGVPREPLWRILNVLRFKYIKDFGNTPGHIAHWSTKGFINFIQENFGQVIAVEKPIPWTILLVKPS